MRRLMVVLVETSGDFIIEIIIRQWDFCGNEPARTRLYKLVCVDMHLISDGMRCELCTKQLLPKQHARAGNGPTLLE